jgi:cell division protein FtsI/penicillin-binding protein 2
MLRAPEARLRLITGLLIIALLPVLGRLVWLQIIQRPAFDAEVEALVERPYSLPSPPSGVILDRQGALLVGNLPVYDVGAEVVLISDKPAAARELAPLLGRDVNDLLDDLEIEGYRWWPLAWGIGGEAAQQLEVLKSGKYRWLTLDPKWRRYYPEGTLACHTLGFVNAQGYGFGLEAFQQRFLRPQTVERTGVVDVISKPSAEELAESAGLRAYPGTDLKLTIDRTIQAFVEGELARAMVEYGARGGTILVMDPRTGAILAMAGSPTYDPGSYGQYSPAQRSLFVDPAISVPYEPGSVFKVITVAAAIDSGSVPRDWSYYDSGAVEYGGVVIRNSDRQAHGYQNLQGVIDRSLNVGVATLTTQYMGADLFFKYVRDFGFGRKTGIGLSGEVAGLVRMPTDWDWTDSSLATVPFGQGIAVTPLQMATAVSTLANHGTMMAPYLVAERAYPDGRVVPTTVRPLGQPVSRATADYLTELMDNYVAGRLENARVPGYRIAGKTGTAQIPVSGGYDPVDVITSFVGFGPLPDPQVLILVNIDRPQNETYLRWGTQTAAPVFQRVASRLFVLLGIPPTETVAGQ